MTMTKPTPGRYADYSTNELIEYSSGNCKNCGNEGILGNGLCAKCWDKQTNKMSYKELGV